MGYPLKVYDPLIIEDVVEHQYHNLDEFLEDIDFVVIMVAHDEIKKEQKRLENKIILDCRNVIEGAEVIHL